MLLKNENRLYAIPAVKGSEKGKWRKANEDTRICNFNFPHIANHKYVLFENIHYNSVS